uniref:Inositol-tetrakisphosphate 1-kinase n=1 Tax=Daphnia magna TaxID=35525 RepID=A0A0P5QTM8_9CRUS
MGSETTVPRHRVGYWFSEKKSKKFNLEEFHGICDQAGLDLIKINLTLPIEDQGPFSAIIHKMTDVIAQADLGDPESLTIVQSFERFICANPKIKIIDPFDNLRQLLDRYQTYSKINNSDLHKAGEVFVPPFVDLVSNDVEENIRKLREAGVRYPFVCKPAVAHGSKMAHQMSIIFHEGAVKDCEPPCVAQTFIPHDAILFKIFVIGKKYFVVERPSLKNFSAAEIPTIFFDSHDVSKPDSVSLLSVLDDDEKCNVHPTINGELLDRVMSMLRIALEMNLFGVDIVVEKNTGHYAIIDINAFPGTHSDNLIGLGRFALVSLSVVCPRLRPLLT